MAARMRRTSGSKRQKASQVGKCSTGCCAKLMWSLHREADSVHRAKVISEYQLSIAARTRRRSRDGWKNCSRFASAKRRVGPSTHGIARRLEGDGYGLCHLFVAIYPRRVTLALWERSPRGRRKTRSAPALPLLFSNAG